MAIQNSDSLSDLRPRYHAFLRRALARYFAESLRRGMKPEQLNPAIRIRYRGLRLMEVTVDQAKPMGRPYPSRQSQIDTG